jgi:putative selenate reductase molybdopterin-binding subunit
MATHRPVRVELDRHEDLFAARCRHPMKFTMKTGVNNDATLQANEMIALVDAGAYGSHSPTVPTNTGNKNLPRYRCKNVHYRFDAIYTNLAIAGAMRGYGTPQGAFALECQIDEAAEAIGMDPVEFRIKTTIRAGDKDEISPRLYEVESESADDDAEDAGWPITTCGIEDCLKQGAEAINWTERRKAYDEHNATNPVIRKGIGAVCLSQGSGVAGIDTANATVKLNEDGSVNLMIGAADIGTGGDTVIAQIVAEVLGIEIDQVMVYAHRHGSCAIRFWCVCVQHNLCIRQCSVAGGTGGPHRYSQTGC